MTPDPEVLLIQTVVTALSIGTLLGFVCHRLRLPTLLGFILTGCLIGPNGLNLVRETGIIDAVAQIGIIFLLFIVGLELSVTQLKQVRWPALMAGILQLGLTTVVLTCLLGLFGIPAQPAFLLASILSLSSTAIVLKSLEETNELETVHGRMILGILIIQDLAIIPLMTLIPAFSLPFSGTTADVLGAAGGVLLKALLFLAVAVLFSLSIIPRVLDRLASINNREIFTLAVAVIGLGMALLTGHLGLSYEAGAFMAGFALSGSLFSRQIIADSRPFRDVFATVFFVSVGMLLDVRFLAGHWAEVFAVTACLVLIKGLVAYGAVRFQGFPEKHSLWAGLALFQIGELSFVLIRRMMDVTHDAAAVVPWLATLEVWSPLLLNSIVLSMFLTPLVLRKLPLWLHRLEMQRVQAAAFPLKEKTDGTKTRPVPETEDPQVVIAGYGPVAQNLVQVLRIQGVPFTVIDMNAQTIKTLKERGIACVFGDASRPDILEAAGVREATLLTLTFPDICSAETAIQQAKRLNPEIHCLVRTRYRDPMDTLYRLGADQVVYEEFETSVSFVFKSLHALGYPRELLVEVMAGFRLREAALDKIPLDPEAEDALPSAGETANGPT